MTENQNPEQKARDNIDALLRMAEWIVQLKSKIDLNAGLGIAVREYQTDIGPANYAGEMSYMPLVDSRKFTELYNVQRLKNCYVARDRQLCIRTIQRLYSILRVIKGSVPFISPFMLAPHG
jgi:hypothetical protein